MKKNLGKMKAAGTETIDLTILSQSAEAAKKHYQAAVRAFERARIGAETAEGEYAACLARFSSAVEAVKTAIKPPLS